MYELNIDPLNRLVFVISAKPYKVLHTQLTCGYQSISIKFIDKNHFLCLFFFRILERFSFVFIFDDSWDSTKTQPQLKLIFPEKKVIAFQKFTLKNRDVCFKKKKERAVFCGTNSHKFVNKILWNKQITKIEVVVCETSSIWQSFFLSFYFALLSL